MVSVSKPLLTAIRVSPSAENVRIDGSDELTATRGLAMTVPSIVADTAKGARSLTLRVVGPA